MKNISKIYTVFLFDEDVETIAGNLSCEEAGLRHTDEIGHIERKAPHEYSAEHMGFDLGIFRTPTEAEEAIITKSEEYAFAKEAIA